LSTIIESDIKTAVKQTDDIDAAMRTHKLGAVTEDIDFDSMWKQQYYVKKTNSTIQHQNHALTRAKFQSEHK
jgi:hypothetical protein